MKEMARQRDVYYYVRHFIIAHGIGPTYNEICEGCRIKSKSHAYKIVSYLIELGYLSKVNPLNHNRSLQCTKKRYKIAS